jgi:hypothetical protein
MPQLPLNFDFLDSNFGENPSYFLYKRARAAYTNVKNIKYFTIQLQIFPSYAMRNIKII